MKKYPTWYLLTAMVFAFLVCHVFGYTDVFALQAMYKCMGKPPQLKGWKSDGGDPCDDSWTGVSCFESSIIHIDLHGLELTGYIAPEIKYLQSLMRLDLSSNHLTGDIPSHLPPNIKSLNLACNNLTVDIPYYLSFLHHLEQLNVSNNFLSGKLGNYFGGLQNLREMDLSHNNFRGHLPISFRSLRALTRLYLQGNAFTGFVAFLADLPLSELNIEDNHFSGVIPKKFQFIKDLWIAGNKFDRVAAYPPWKSPTDILPINITNPPTTEPSASPPTTEPSASPPTIEPSVVGCYHAHKENNKRKMGGGKIASLVAVGGLLAAFAAIFVVLRIRRSQMHVRSLENYEIPLIPLC